MHGYYWYWWTLYSKHYIPVPFDKRKDFILCILVCNGVSQEHSRSANEKASALIVSCVWSELLKFQLFTFPVIFPLDLLCYWVDFLFTCIVGVWSVTSCHSINSSMCVDRTLLCCIIIIYTLYSQGQPPPSPSPGGYHDVSILTASSYLLIHTHPSQGS